MCVKKVADVVDIIWWKKANMAFVKVTEKQKPTDRDLQNPNNSE